ncbi:MAG: P1 family peptidase [Gemmatimonadota bacterium]|nr:P1 family peptidase [Gemmatimonadota bacterium]MDE3128308.1 P1 family peptidase [Gemmatimonadota bacterium]MDE3173559.1 P1 family peptidase [Gemmatimonadota bacterium]MDE3214882.1 P1 family peptidase [Gemmatimonadota bacterium]
MAASRLPALFTALAVLGPAALGAQTQTPVRARQIGVAPGIFRPGANDAITDVAGVLVGQTTVDDGDSVHTGVTAVLPHAGNMFTARVPAAIVVGNGFGKLLGVTQVGELGEIETPILLTCTLCVWRAADAMVAWLLAGPGMENVRSINPVVGETNDGTLNAIRSRPIQPADVVHALESARGGPVAEGSVGAGRGTIAFGWKGGIGTSSRVLPKSLGGWTVGVLVQTNFGGILDVDGVPVGRELGRYSFDHDVADRSADGSCMIVVATDAPILDRNLARLARRAIVGMGRTGSFESNGSGDYVIAFSADPKLQRGADDRRPDVEELTNEEMSPLFEAVVEATQEAIYDSMFMATAVTSARGLTVRPLPIDSVKAILRKYGR